MIRVGTSGYSYDDWVGPFYPRGTRKRDFLAYYAGQFQSCEINFTYYRLPERRTLQRMLDVTAGRMRFAIKMTRTVTHDRSQSAPEDLAHFRSALAPWVEADVLGAVLFQFPHSFGATQTNRAWLERSVAALPGLPAVAEFRNKAWVSQSTFEWLTALGVGFCCVDEPRLRGLLPPLAVVTASPGYVRFHGRNAEKWYEHDHAWERYDYRYARAELEEWVPRLVRMSERTPELFVFFNNHFEAKAVDAAHSLAELLTHPLG